MMDELDDALFWYAAHEIFEEDTWDYRIYNDICIVAVNVDTDINIHLLKKDGLLLEYKKYQELSDDDREKWFDKRHRNLEDIGE